MTQVNVVLRHLKAGKKITPLTALRDYGIMRLAHCIYLLRRRGYKIYTDQRRQGDKKYAVYWLDPFDTGGGSLP